MPENNILPIPPILDRLAKKLRGYLTQEAANHQEWVDIQMGICLTLVEMREQFPADVTFGQWCDASGFGKTVISHQDRAAAIAMGRDPKALRDCLEATDRRSLREIHRLEFSRFTSTGKPTRRKNTKKPATMSNASDAPARRNQTVGPDTYKTCLAIRDTVEAGEQVARKKWVTELGVSEATVQRAEHYELGRLEGLQEAMTKRRPKFIDPPILTGPITTNEDTGRPPPGAPYEELAAWQDKIGSKYAMHAPRIMQLDKDTRGVRNIAAAVHDVTYMDPLKSIANPNLPTPEQAAAGLERMLAHVLNPDAEEPGDRIDFAKEAHYVQDTLTRHLEPAIARLKSWRTGLEPTITKLESYRAIMKDLSK